jgi:hypothetical protein
MYILVMKLCTHVYIVIISLHKIAPIYFLLIIISSI